MWNIYNYVDDTLNSNLYKRGKLVTTKIPVGNQNNSNNCGLFAIAFPGYILTGDLPSDTTFSLRQMQNHLLMC